MLEATLVNWLSSEWVERLSLVVAAAALAMIVYVARRADGPE